MEILNNLGTGTLLGSFGSLSLVGTILFKVIRSKEFRRIVVSAFKLVYNSFLNRSSLSHSIFTVGEYYKGLVNNIKFECSNKTELYNILLKTKIEVTLEKLNSWIKLNNKEIKKINKIELSGKLFKLIDEIDTEFRNRVKEKFFDLLRDEPKSLKLYNLIFDGTDKVIGFSSFQEKNEDFIFNYIEDIPIYSNSSNMQAINTVFDFINIGLVTSVRQSRETFEHLNGELCRNEIK